MKADFATGGITAPDETAAIKNVVAQHRESGHFDIIHNRSSILGGTPDDVEAQADAGATWWIAGATPFEDLTTARRYIQAGPPSNHR